MNSKSGIHHQGQDDQETYDGFLRYFRAKDTVELVAEFNRQVRVGITGVRMQMGYIRALNEVLNERTGQEALDHHGPVIRPLHYLTIVDGELVQQVDN